MAETKKNDFSKISPRPFKFEQWNFAILLLKVKYLKFCFCFQKLGFLLQQRPLCYIIEKAPQNLHFSSDFDAVFLIRKQRRFTFFWDHFILSIISRWKEMHLQILRNSKITFFFKISLLCILWFKWSGCEMVALDETFLIKLIFFCLKYQKLIT